MFAPRKFFEWGGIAASIILVAFGIASIVVGIDGRSTVRDSLKQERLPLTEVPGRLRELLRPSGG